MAVLLQPPGALKLNTASNISSTWKHFKQDWSLYEIASGVQDKEENVLVATFLHVAGKDALDRYNGFIWKENADKSILQTIIAKFDEDCTKKTNIIAERCKFLKRKQ